MNNWSRVTCKMAAPVRNYLEAYWPCAGGLTAVKTRRYAVARPDKIGTDPMAARMLLLLSSH